MIQYHIYITALLFLSVISIIIGVWAFRSVPTSPEKWEKLPRNVIYGLIIAAVDLTWCVPHSKPIAPTGMIPWLIPIAIVCLWLSYQFLDYLFSRAVGGFMILFAHYMLYTSFAYQAPVKPLFSFFCYALGTLGIFFCGKPHLMRDFIRKIASSYRWRISVAALMTVYAAVALFVAVMHITKSGI